MHTGNMGLLLICGKKSYGFSYSTMNYIRQELIQAYILWRQHQDLSTEDLERVISSDTIDYQLFEKLDYNECGIFEGLYRFVNHSDCDGTWSWIDAGYILTTFNALRHNLKERSSCHYHYDGLKTILYYSADKEKDIQFC